MRSFLLTIIAVAAAVCQLQAQNFPPDYRFEAGVNFGGNVITMPKGPQGEYQGSKTNWMPTGALTFNYNFSNYWQLGGEIGASTWKTTGSWPLTDAYGKTLQNKDVTFLVANPAINVSAVGNRLVPFFSKYKDYNKANFYYGVMLGVIATVNDGGTMQSNYNASPDQQFVYTSQYNYGYGIGYTAGAQVGLSYYISENLGINIQGAARYAKVGTDDTRYGHVNANFHLWYFPCTVGFRLRF